MQDIKCGLTELTSGCSDTPGGSQPFLLPRHTAASYLASQLLHSPAEFSVELLFTSSQTPSYIIAGEHKKNFAFVLVEFQKVDGDPSLNTIWVAE